TANLLAFGDPSMTKLTPEEHAAINAKIEQLWNTSPAVLEGSNSTKADWTKFQRQRTRLFNKLGGEHGVYWGCRYCGNEQPEFYMLHANDLWRKIINIEPGRRCYGAGWVCLACAAKRLFPRQLYNSDFGPEGRGELEDGTPLDYLDYTIAPLRWW